MELGPAREAERDVAALLEAEAAAIAAFPGEGAAGLRRLSRALLPALGAPGSDGVAARLAVARTSPALLLALESTRHLAALLRAFGAFDEGERAALARGERIGAVALADAAGAPRARLARGGGGWQLTAEKPFVTNAPLADWIAVVAETDGGEALALVTPSDAGVTVGAPIELLGLDGLAVAPLSAGATVPDARVLGPFDAPSASAQYARDADLTLAIAGAGLARAVLRVAHRHARAHVRDGRPVIAHQEVAFALAQVHAQADAAELLCHRAAWLVEAGDAEADTVVRCAKVFCTENAERAASACLQAMGGEGYRRDGAAARAYRDAKGLALAGTTTEVARMAIADALLSRSEDRWT